MIYLLGQLYCVPHKRSYCLVQNLQKGTNDQNESGRWSEEWWSRQWWCQGVGWEEMHRLQSHCSKRINLQKPLNCKLHRSKLAVQLCTLVEHTIQKCGTVHWIWAFEAWGQKWLKRIGIEASCTGKSRGCTGVQWLDYDCIVPSSKLHCDSFVAAALQQQVALHCSSIAALR